MADLLLLFHLVHVRFPRLQPLVRQHMADAHAKTVGCQSASTVALQSAGQSPGFKDWLQNELAWMQPLLCTLLAQMCFQNLWVTLTTTVPQTLKSKKLLRETIL